MKQTIAGLVCVSLLVAIAGGGGAAADADKGGILAKRWCASCHVVAADQQRGSTSAAPFSEIARQPGLDAAKLALFLLAPHPRMPDMSLSRSEAADLAAYIERQGK
jgi:mono/diheme cytochrome c family protein